MAGAQVSIAQNLQCFLMSGFDLVYRAQVKSFFTLPHQASCADVNMSKQSTNGELCAYHTVTIPAGLLLPNIACFLKDV